MNMKLFSLVSGADFPATKLQVKIAGSLSAFTDRDMAFEQFASLKALFPALAGALKSAELIVIAAEPRLYNKVKQKLTAALSLPCAPDSEILRRLEAAELDDAQKNAEASVPEGSVVFMTKDGVRSGFAVKKGRQEILFVALDDDRLDVVLRNGVVPYLTSGETITPPAETRLPHAEVQPVDIVSGRERDVPPPAAEKEDMTDITVRTVNALREKNYSVAVNGNQNAEYVKQFGKTAPDFSTFFSFTPHVEDKGEYNVTDYTAQMAKSSRELAGATFGACISDICDTEDCSFICIAVAGESSALVRKLYKEPDETNEDFIRDAAEELLELIGEKASGLSSVGIEISQNEGFEDEKPKMKKSSKIIISVAVILLAAALAVSGYFFVRYRNQKSEPPTQPTTEETTEATTAEPVTAPAQTVLLSQMMYDEMLTGVAEENTPEGETGVGGTAPETTENSNAIPDYITVNGVQMDAKEAVAKIVATEIGSDTNAEAIKAQAVVTYTYLKYRNTGFRVSGITLADAYSDNIYNAVNSVFGEYVSYNNAAAFTPYFRLSAGKTTEADAVYGKAFPYLRAVSSTTDRNQDGYKTEKTFSSEEMKKFITDFDSTIVLPEATADWLKVTKHDGAISTGVGYVQTVQVGDKELSGIDFKTKLLANNISSHCFAIAYTASSDSFRITAYGDGLGVGMSMLGANRLAGNGSTYTQILSRYYPGTKLS